MRTEKNAAAATTMGTIMITMNMNIITNTAMMNTNITMTMMNMTTAAATTTIITITTTPTRSSPASGRETTHKFTKESIAAALAELENAEKYGQILRAKGIVEAEDGSWIHFDYVPGCPDIRSGSAGLIGRLCVIGAKIDEEAIAALFGIQ